MAYRLNGYIAFKINKLAFTLAVCVKSQLISVCFPSFANTIARAVCTMYVLYLTTLDQGSDVALDAVQTCGLAVAFATPKAMLSFIFESGELILDDYLM